MLRCGTYLSLGPKMKAFMLANANQKAFESGACDSSSFVHNTDHKENDDHHDNDCTKSSKA